MDQHKRFEQHRAASHFGLGPGSGDLAAMGDDPRGWLEEQLNPGSGGTGPSVPASKDSIATHSERLRERRQAQQRAQGNPEKIAELEASQQAFRRETRQLVGEQSLERFRYAAACDDPFRERLVQFWSNHFTVSRQGKPQLIGACVAYENEAIRASLDGHFNDMLHNVVSHPAMLIYLDNVQSMGPDSQLGRRRERGLNENLAREVLELHTLGLDGGYEQADVTSLAKMLTGWTVGNERFRRFEATPGAFAFVPVMHQPGSAVLLGRRYAEGGADQAAAALADLARHPATARFIAEKLVRHFVSDEPPTAAVAVVEAAFRESEGHLPTVHRALLELPQAWDGDYRKFKPPYDYLLSVHRGLDLETVRANQVLGPLRLMNQVPFSAPTPAGWDDTRDHWAAPAALKQRIDWSIAVAERLANDVDLQGAAGRLIPPAANPALALSISRAESTAQGLGLLLASPDFQWR